MFAAFPTWSLCVVFFSLAVYFLLAAFFPALRMRWSRGATMEWTWSKKSVSKTRWSVLGNRMGTASCFGIALSFAGAALAFTPIDAPIGFMLGAGLVMAVFGFLIDWRSPRWIKKRFRK
jgi:hypothetical protein